LSASLTRGRLLLFSVDLFGACRLTNKGDRSLLAFGRNAEGQCGGGVASAVVLQPQLVPIKVRKVSSFWRHIVAIDG
jgi:alpha-tubulin suppressor-like RCC1 family protein